MLISIICRASSGTVYNNTSLVMLNVLVCQIWFGFASKTNQQQVDTYLRRSKKCGFCPPELPSFQDKVTLWHSNYLTKFNTIIIICLSTLFHHLRHHHRTTISRQDHTTSSFLSELDISLTLIFFYKNAFQRHLLIFTSLIFIVLSFYCYEIAFCQFSIKRILDWIGLE